MLTVPYVQAGAFRAHPTYLDSLNLRSGDANLADQVAELTTVLLMASAEADNYLEFGAGGTLAAHVVSENRRCKPDADGLLHLHPAHIPVVSVGSIAYGYDFTALTTVTNPNVWVRDGRNIVANLGSGVFANPRLLGTWSRLGLFTTWTYTAGYPNTVLAADAAASDTAVSVADATGIVAGSTLRIWDPGAEEACTVATGYTVGSTTLPLVAPLAYAHGASGDSPLGISALPAEVHLAIIQWTTALLMRPNSKAVSQFKGASMRLSTAGEDDAWGDASGLVAAGRAALEPYRRIV